MKKYRDFLVFIALLIITAKSVIPAKVLAFCPLCTVTVGVGLGLSRWLKVDDTISGLWIGALILSSVFWLMVWLKKRKIGFRGLLPLAIVSSYAVVIIPLYYSKIIGHPGNQIFGIDKLVFGITLGSLVFVLGLMLNYALKRINNGKQFFYFQKVVAPLVLLTVFSLAMYFIVKNIKYGA